MLTRAVFQGGGIKGIALVGALKRIEETGVRFEAVGGTSAGSIVAALYAAGYSADEMKKLLDETAFDKLLDGRPIGIFSLITHRGLYKGRKFYEWMYKLLEPRGVIAFRDLKDIDLKIVASDITNREIVIFDVDKNPTMKIAEAVRMSISLPLFFEPYQLGERLVIDGGILSNYPLFIFDDPEKTVGFKLVSKGSAVPERPSSAVSYFYSIVNTMMDAHDKEDERRNGYKNTIHIDNAGIPTTKFKLTDAEKEALFKNGYFAASQFVNHNVELINNRRNRLIQVDAPFSRRLTVDVPDDMKPEEIIRVSISGLFRIYVDGKYLLVAGKRINQYQPIGGVFKRLQKSTHSLRDLGVMDDDKLLIDITSHNDLRVRVPLEVLPKFLEWFRSESGREITPEREFREELLETNLLPFDCFKYIFYERIGTHVQGISYSQYLQCYEVLIAEIYELDINSEQLSAFRDMQKRATDEYIWCDEEVIRSGGYDPRLKTDVARISETARWILPQNPE